MSKKEYAEPLLLPPLTGKCGPTVEHFDVSISAAHMYSYAYEGDEVLSLNFTPIHFDTVFSADENLSDEEFVDNYVDSERADEVYEYQWFKIEPDTADNSLYSQLISAAFCNEDMPTDNFNAELLLRKTVRICLRNGRFLVEVKPLVDSTQKQPTG